MVQFVVSAKAKTLIKAAGIEAVKGARMKLPPCPLNVGDVLSFPNAETVYFRVALRVLQATPKGNEWFVMLEPAANPGIVKPDI